MRPFSFLELGSKFLFPLKDWMVTSACRHSTFFWIWYNFLHKNWDILYFIPIDVSNQSSKAIVPYFYDLHLKSKKKNILKEHIKANNAALRSYTAFTTPAGYTHKIMFYVYIRDYCANMLPLRNSKRIDSLILALYSTPVPSKVLYIDLYTVPLYACISQHPKHSFYTFELKRFDLCIIEEGFLSLVVQINFFNNILYISDIFK